MGVALVMATLAMGGRQAHAQTCSMPNIGDSDQKWTEYNECQRKARDARVGKYFCFFNNVLGIQYPLKDGFPDRDASPFAGKITPNEGKFFIEITKTQGYGKPYRLTSKNDLAPHIALSEDAFKFEGSTSTFLFAVDNSFISFQSFGSSYLADGRCERIGEAR